MRNGQEIENFQALSTILQDLDAILNFGKIPLKICKKLQEKELKESPRTSGIHS